MADRLLRFLNALVSLAVALALLTAGAYSVYALWDNHRVYSAAGDIQADLLRLKPAADAEQDGSASFAELRKINSDIRAWLTLDNTEIDYPILQGADNLAYINTDVYGNFALAGSIFLDEGCEPDFRDVYALVHGHHMDNRKMFGDLDLYKDEKFFSENPSGRLILSDRAYTLEIFACLVTPASEKAIFAPRRWKSEVTGLLDFAADNAMYLRRDVLDRMRAAEESPRILAMSTCSSEFTDARTIILAVMEPYLPELEEHP